jgi:hypothetical protein
MKLRSYRFGRDYRIKREDYDRFVEERATKPEDDNIDDQIQVGSCESTLLWGIDMTSFF